MPFFRHGRMLLIAKRHFRDSKEYRKRAEWHAMKALFFARAGSYKLAREHFERALELTIDETLSKTYGNGLVDGWKAAKK